MASKSESGDENDLFPDLFAFVSLDVAKKRAQLARSTKICSESQRVQSITMP
jgi:hypothetical protein